VSTELTDATFPPVRSPRTQPAAPLLFKADLAAALSCELVVLALEHRPLLGGGRRHRRTLVQLREDVAYPNHRPVSLRSLGDGRHAAPSRLRRRLGGATMMIT